MNYDIDRRGHPRRSLWAVVYLAALVMGSLYLADVTETAVRDAVEQGLTPERVAALTAPDDD